MISFNEKEQKELKRFNWNYKPTQDQINRMDMMRMKGKELAEFMLLKVEDCEHRNAAIRDLRKAITQCNLAIAHESI